MPIDKSCLERYNIKIEDLKPKIFESIVAIYGEKYRELINDRLNRIYINHNVTYEDVKENFRYQSNYMDTMLYIKFLNGIGMEISEEFKNCVLSKNGSFMAGYEELGDDYMKILEQFLNDDFSIKNEILYAFDDERLKNALTPFDVKSILRKRCEILELLGLEITPQNYKYIINTEEGKSVIENIRKAQEVANECKNARDQFIKENEPIRAYIEECENLDDELTEKYRKIFYDEIENSLSEEEKSEREKNPKEVISKYTALYGTYWRYKRI